MCILLGIWSGAPCSRTLGKQLVRHSRVIILLYFIVVIIYYFIVYMLFHHLISYDMISFCMCSCIVSFIRSYFVLYFVYISIYLISNIYIYIFTYGFFNAITQLMGALISIIWKSQLPSDRPPVFRLAEPDSFPEVLRHFAAAVAGPRAKERKKASNVALEYHKGGWCGENGGKSWKTTRPLNQGLLLFGSLRRNHLHFGFQKQWHSKHKVDGQTPVSVGMAKTLRRLQ